MKDPLDFYLESDLILYLNSNLGISICPETNYLKLVSEDPIDKIVNPLYINLKSMNHRLFIRETRYDPSNAVAFKTEYVIKFKSRYYLSEDDKSIILRKDLLESYKIFLNLKSYIEDRFNHILIQECFEVNMRELFPDVL